MTPDMLPTCRKRDAYDGINNSHEEPNRKAYFTNGNSHSTSVADVEIIDIRRDGVEMSLLKAIRQGLHPEAGKEKRLPTLLLYDEKGLKIFEEITYLEEYYLTNAEIQVLECYADQIAQRLQSDSIVLELGSGNLRKIDILLKALDSCGKKVDYYALDLSFSELQRTLSAIPKDAYKHVRCFGLLGTYDDGLQWLKQSSVKAKPKAVLTLGSSIGNFSRPEAAAFLNSFAEALEPGDVLFVGIDACKDMQRVYHAYNDRFGLTHKFVLNGLSHANEILGYDAFDINKWKVIGEYNEAEGRHQAFVTPLQDVTIEDVFIRAGENVRIEESYKYTPAESAELFANAGTVQVAQWTNETKDYGMHMIAKQSYAFALDANLYASSPVPSFQEWEHLWTLWDTVTRKMIPDEELMQKPIKLRNACIFYLGHIPTFFDMKLTQSITGSELTEPKHYSKIFERGIDPDVENPEHCHAHSEVPDEWPPLDEMLDYQQRVRQRVQRLYDSGDSAQAKIGRCLWLGYEHEAMHLETLLYMLVQSEKTLAPPGTSKPDFAEQAHQAEAQAVPNDWITVPDSLIKIGMDDPETEGGPVRYFGWDPEKPTRTAHVKAFSAKARPITVGEYALYLQDTHNNELPASWYNNTLSNGQDKHNGCMNGAAAVTDNDRSSIKTAFLQDKAVRTVYGAVPLAYALHWPVAASYNEITACAQWMGGRIPTLEETRSIYNFVDEMQRMTAVKKALNNTIPAVNSHLINDGVEETPPECTTALDAGVGPKPYDAFVDLKGCNVGFQHWHPTPVTQKGGKLCGQADMGGVWEWTSTPLRKHEGFQPMALYPAYSQDFHDGKHNIVLGGSWATVPRLAGRKSL